MEESNKPLATYAFEGINAAGKSTVLKEIESWYQSRGYLPNINKIGGMGDSPRMNRLKKILDHRERLRRKEQLTLKQERDFLKDRIFRLAIRQQVKNYERILFDKERAISLLDRTPLMSYTYSSSVDSNNPYLTEILDEGLVLTRQLSLDKIFLFDIDPITVYSRIVCRSLEDGESMEKQISKLTGLIPAPDDIKKTVAERTLAMLDSGMNFQKKKFRIWDFMAYEEVERQAKTYLDALQLARERIGVQTVKIDASQSLDQVVDSVKEYML